MMKSFEGGKRSRRRFMSLGFLGGLGLFSQKAAASIPVPEQETIQMLTPEGDLVEVPRDVVSRSEHRRKVRNADILNWTRAIDKRTK